MWNHLPIIIHSQFKGDFEDSKHSICELSASLIRCSLFATDTVVSPSSKGWWSFESASSTLDQCAPFATMCKII